jgi:hypothetical protein
LDGNDDSQDARVPRFVKREQEVERTGRAAGSREPKVERRKRQEIMTPEPETEIEKLFQDYKKLVESGGETEALEARKKIQRVRERLDKK